MAKRPQTKPSAAPPNAGWYQPGKTAGRASVGRIKLQDLKRANSIVKRRYIPGMTLSHLYIAVDSVKGELDQGMAAKVTKPLIRKWFLANEVDNDDEATVVQRQTAFFAPKATTTGNVDGRYLQRVPEFDRALKRVFYGYKKKERGRMVQVQPQMWGPQKLYELMKKEKPALVDKGLSRAYITKWRSAQQVAAVHSPWVADHLNVRKVAQGPGKVVQLDIKNLQSKIQGGYQYFISMYDMWTKYLFAEPMRSRESANIVAAVKKMVAESKRIKAPIKGVNSDNEFRSKELLAYFASEGIKIFHNAPYNPQAAGGVERSNGVVARMLGMYERQADKKDWPTAIKGLVKNYNNSWQSSIRTTPLDAIQSWVDDDQVETRKIQSQLRRNKAGVVNNIDTLNKYAKGDRVQLRIALEKAGGLAFTRAFYVIDKVIVENQKDSQDRIVSYLLKNEAGEDMDQVFYNDNLRKWVKSEKLMEQPELFLIQYIIRPVVPAAGQYKNNRCFVVKYHGFKAEYALRSDLERDTPQLLQKFEDQWNVKWTKNGTQWSVTSDRD